MSDEVSYVLLIALLVFPVFTMITMGDDLMKAVFALQSLILGVPFG